MYETSSKFGNLNNSKRTIHKFKENIRFKSCRCNIKQQRRVYAVRVFYIFVQKSICSYVRYNGCE